MAYESANVGGDEYTAYPLGQNNKPVPVEMVTNGKNLKFIQPSVAKEKFVKQVAKKTNTTVEEVKLNIFGEKPEAKRFFYINVVSYHYKGIYGSYNKSDVTNYEKLSDYNDVLIPVEENSSCYGMMEIKAELLDLNGKKNRDGFYYKYVGPKYTYLYLQNVSTGSSAIMKYDGTEETTIFSSDSYEEVREEFERLMKKGKDSKGRIYKEFNDSDWSSSIQNTKEYDNI